MAAPTPSRTISVTIAKPPGEVYDYVTEPTLLPTWAPGLAKTVEEQDGHWVVGNDAGQWILEFEPRNELGVADHTVTLPDGSQQLNPMRVLPNGDGTEVTFTLFRAEAPSDAVFDELTATVQADLDLLRDVLEAT